MRTVKSIQYAYNISTAFLSFLRLLVWILLNSANDMQRATQNPKDSICSFRRLFHIKIILPTLMKYECMKRILFVIIIS